MVSPGMIAIEITLSKRIFLMNRSGVSKLFLAKCIQKYLRLCGSYKSRLFNTAIVRQKQYKKLYILLNLPLFYFAYSLCQSVIVYIVIFTTAGYLNIINFILAIMEKITIFFALFQITMMISSQWQNVNSLSNMNLKILEPEMKK